MMKFLLRLACVLFLLAGTSAQDGGFDLSDALGPDPVPTPKKPADKPPKGDVPPTQKPKKPSSGDFDGFDLSDALGPDPVPTPKKPADKPPKGGGGSFDDFDLSDVLDNDYKPDKGRSGGRAQDPGSDPQGGADQPQAEAGSGPIAGIISAIGVAVLGAASSYFAYQKKKLCFKLQGGADPESGKGNQGTHSDPQVLSNLLQAK